MTLKLVSSFSLTNAREPARWPFLTAKHCVILCATYAMNRYGHRNVAYVATIFPNEPFVNGQWQETRA